MDITNSSESRVEAGVKILTEGHSISFEGVSFHLNKKILSVTSFSDYDHIENVTEAEAKEKMDRSKAVAEHLAELSPLFSKVWKKSKHEYYFGYDYGKGGIGLAQRIENQFEWKK